MIGHSLGRMDMCFDIGSQHLGCRGQNTSRIQHKEVLTPSNLFIFFMQAIEFAVSHDRLASQSQILHRAPFCQNGAKSEFEMCFGPSTLGAGAKTCL